jgi:hypothetical protein
VNRQQYYSNRRAFASAQERYDNLIPEEEVVEPDFDDEFLIEMAFDYIRSQDLQKEDIEQLSDAFFELSDFMDNVKEWIAS